MVVIGGMRSFLGPALGALFFILFREFLSIWTPHWLFYFGLLFVGFIVFSPTGLVGVAGRLMAPFRKRRQSNRLRWPAVGRPRFLRCREHCVRAIDGGRLVLAARDLDRSFGGIHAVEALIFRYATALCTP